MHSNRGDAEDAEQQRERATTLCDPTRISWPNKPLLFIIRADNLQEDLS